MRIGSRVGMQLIHVTSWGGSRTTYLIQTAWVDRPPAGIRHGRLRCAACGAMVRFRLYGETGARMRRRRWLLITLVAAAALAIIAAMLIRGDSDFIERIAPALGAVAAVAFGTLMVSGHLLRIEDGVRGARWRDGGDNGPHLFKRLNPIGAWLKPGAVDSPVRAEIVFDDSDASTSETSGR